MNSSTVDVSAQAWIAACADRLQQRWRRVEKSELRAVASELWHDAKLRGLPPEDAAMEWLRPVDVRHDDNANTHPLMNRMQKPKVNPKTKMPSPPERQNKFSLVLMRPEDVDR